MRGHTNEGRVIGLRGWQVFTLPVQGRAVAGMLDVLTGRARVINLPEDAQVERFGYDVTCDRWLIAISSLAFPLTPPGERFPEMPLLCERVGHGAVSTDSCDPDL